MSFDDQRPGGPIDYAYSTPSRPQGDPTAARPFLFAAMIGALFGSIFSGLSTSDFINHLDRQVHSIHCSFIPGAGAEIGESGCRTVMLSPYSSLFRESMWGGLPISLLAFAVFAYLVMRTSQLAFAKSVTKKETLFLVAAVLLPVLMSILYGSIAVSKIGAVCKLCVGVYFSSALAFVGAVGAHLKAAAKDPHDQPMPQYARWFGEGVLFVAVIAGVYVMFAPTSQKSVDGCGTLAKKDDPAGIFIPMGKGHGGTQSIAVLDPLCPACKNFDARLQASDLYHRLDLDAVLFPLDATCNWMVKESLHPGACAVSEAMLCDKEGAVEILDYAFAHQEELREEAKADDAKLRRRLEKEFPKVKGCLGKPETKNKLNKSLRWAVANALPVLTPQLFIGDKRVCDEDTDLGLEYTVSRMLDGSSPSRRSR
jgi:uncharacterized membrane protein